MFFPCTFGHPRQVVENFSSPHISIIMAVNILGISAFFHDSAAALLSDGEVIAAAQEERFTRVKGDASFPAKAIEYCLREGNLSPAEVQYVAYYENPMEKFERLLETHVAFSPSAFDLFKATAGQWAKHKLQLPALIKKGTRARVRRRIVRDESPRFTRRQRLFPSPYDEAAILTLDAVGEWSTSSIGYGIGHQIHLTHEMRFPHSLGMLYSAFTYYAGFKVNSGEYKLMGLAPYGEPCYVDHILEHIVEILPDGSFYLDMSYFNYCQGRTMTSEKFHAHFGGPPRKTESRLTQKEMNLAASIQVICEQAVLAAARHAHKMTGMNALVMAGGVALNCVANGRLLREGPFRDIWIQPAAGDAGSALGAAYLVWHHQLEQPRLSHPMDRQKGSLLGPAF